MHNVYINYNIMHIMAVPDLEIASVYYAHVIQITHGHIDIDT